MRVIRMRGQILRRVIRFLVPRILAAAAIFLAVAPAIAAEAQMVKVSETAVDITGGSGNQAWRLRYGLILPSEFKPHFVVGEGNRAWYSYGGWLREIDTQKGVVLGRWHYPGEIVELTPEGTKVQVEIEDKADDVHIYRRKFQLNPSDPHVPYWPTNLLMLYRASINEGQMLWPEVINNGAPTKIPSEEAKKLLPKLEEAARRDPYTPWFRVGLGRVLRDLGDPRASEEFQAAIKSPGTDFTELFQISRYLDATGEKDLARAAFDRAYQDFWQKGNDPRMLTALINGLVLYTRRGNDWGDAATAHGRELIERVYMLMPYAEGAPIAWRVYADYLSAHGLPDQSRVWRARAEDAAQNAMPISSFMRLADYSLLLGFATVWAAIIYAFVLFFRYRPQRKLDLAAGQRTGEKSRRFAFFGTEYWSRRQRIAFFSIVFLGWFGVGVSGQYVGAILRQSSAPLSTAAGSLGGPATIAMFSRGLPASHQRDLMLAIAYQQDGQLDKAEALYRKLPQFAESWNNLGVILKQMGKNEEAKAAFEKALSMDPKMAEAALNLGHPPSDFWTEQHQKYLPGQPMLAPPSQAHAQSAFIGGSMATVFLRALAGPMSTGDLFGPFNTLRKIVG